MLTGPVAPSGSRKTGHIVRQPPALGHRRRARRGPRPGAWSCASSRCCPSSASCAATSRGRAGRTTRPPARVSGIELPPGLREARAAADADLHAVDEGRGRPRRGDRLRRGRRARRRPRADGPRARRVDRALPLRRRARAARARRDPGRHEVRVRARRGRRARRRRRGADPGLLALLAGRRLRARPRAAELRQAVRARLGRGQRLGQGAARPADPRRRGRAHARAATSRPTSGWPASPSTRGWRGPRREGAGPHPAQGRDPRSAGHRGRARAARPRLRRACATSTSAGSSSSTSTTRPGSRRCAGACWPTRWSRTSRSSRPTTRGGARVKTGVVRFPGSCDDVDALPGRRARRRRPCCSGTATRTCRASTRSSSPAASPTATTCASGRSPASRRSWAPSPSSPARAARCSASATASRSSARPGCCRARCCRTPRCASSAARSTSRSCDDGHAVHADVRRGRAALDPGQAHHRPLLGPRRAARRARGRRPGRPALRRGPGLQRLVALHRRGLQRAAATSSA